MSWQELFVNPEVPPDDDPWEMKDDPDEDVNVEWAKMVLFGMALVGGFVFVVSSALALWIGSMMIQWP
jgi:hypothetical protein